MLVLIKRFYRHEGGATATEYAMLVVFIALAVAVGATALGGGINTLFNTVGSRLTAAATTVPTLPLPGQ